MYKAGQEIGLEMSMSHEASPNADVNFYVDLQNTYFNQKTNKDVALFTHADKNSSDWLIGLLNSRNGWSLDGIVHMNKRYEKMSVEVGVDRPMTTIIPGETANLFPLKKTKIGIVSRGGFPGYGQHFLEEVFEKIDDNTLKHFKFFFLGDGWREGIEPILQKKGVEVAFMTDADYSIYPKFYNTIDYLLIPSLYTAGPMSFQEALASGVPVISSDVGFCNYEFEADRVYKPGDVDGLISILLDIWSKKFARRKQVEWMSWKNYMTELKQFLKEKVM